MGCPRPGAAQGRPRRWPGRGSRAPRQPTRARVHAATPLLLPANTRPSPQNPWIGLPDLTSGPYVVVDASNTVWTATDGVVFKLCV